MNLAEMAMQGYLPCPVFDFPFVYFPDLLLYLIFRTDYYLINKAYGTISYPSLSCIAVRQL